MTANNMMNSFEFSQPPQQPLIEPANFVGPLTTMMTTQVTAFSSSQEGNPYWSIGLPSFPVESIIAGLSFGFLFVFVRRRRAKLA
ncbi:MAG: hypothetical protein ABSA92_02915 [Candidatus Bathyarchaeia archaeon]|jgi:hypothetical protein